MSKHQLWNTHFLIELKLAIHWKQKLLTDSCLEKCEASGGQECGPEKEQPPPGD